MTIWKPWEKETELCTDFCLWAKQFGWTPYAETAGWDILLVRNADGVQIGIEAKLALNVKVLCQVLEREKSYTAGRGPDYRAVLAPEPKTQTGLTMIARRLNITVIQAFQPYDYRTDPRFRPELPRVGGDRFYSSYSDDREWFERCPDERHELPEYIPDVTAGDKAPLQLTPWKIKAIRCAVLIEIKGYITRADFKALGMDARRWTDWWLTPAGDGKWLPAPGMPDFKRQHPVNYEQIKADAAKWITPAMAQGDIFTQGKLI